MKRRIAQWVLDYLGVSYKLDAPLPPKCIVVVVPHTSNWDFPLGVSVRTLINEEIVFIAKRSLFYWPYGFIFRWLGGMPVDRSKSNNFVQSVAEMYQKRDNFKTVISPEGTRTKVDKLKSGFYYIAKTAQIPIVLCAFDWENKEVRFDQPYYTTDDKEKDFEYIYDFFDGIKGFTPENSFTRPIKS